MKIFISLFIILNLSTILFMNRPVFFVNACTETIKSYNDPKVQHNLSMLAWYIKRYAHIVGLDNQWQMFGRQTRFNWKYVIKAKYENLKEVILPLPNQTKRTFIQSEFIDFKEAKFHLNTYSRPYQRETHARYLCRKFPEHEGSMIKSIIYELHWQNIYTPQEARKYGTVLHPGKYGQPINEFACPQGKKEN